MGFAACIANNFTVIKNVQQRLEGQKYVTLSLIPYLIFLIRNDIEKLTLSPHHPQAEVLVNIMRDDFFERWDHDNEGTVWIDVVGPRGRVTTCAHLGSQNHGTIVPQVDYLEIWNHLKGLMSDVHEEVMAAQNGCAVVMQPLIPAPAPDDIFAMMAPPDIGPAVNAQQALPIIIEAEL